MIEAAISKPQYVVVLSVENHQQQNLVIGFAMRIEERKTISLNHHVHSWGCVYFGVVLLHIIALYSMIFLCLWRYLRMVAMSQERVDLVRQFTYPQRSV